MEAFGYAQGGAYGGFAGDGVPFGGRISSYRRDHAPVGGTFVSDAFIDSCMGRIPGEYVKVYLYLVRSLEKGAFSMDGATGYLGITEGDMGRAISFLDDEGLLRAERDDEGRLLGIEMVEVESDSKNNGGIRVYEKREGKEKDLSPKIPEVSHRPSSPEDCQVSDIEDFVREDENGELLFIIERYLGRTLGPMDISTVIYWKEGLSFSEDMIEYLVEVCLSRKLSRLSQMNKVAREWSSLGLKTPDDVRVQVIKKRKHPLSASMQNAVKEAFGIKDRSLADKEKDYVRKWDSQWHFSEEIIAEACGRTLLRTQGANFEYADVILKNWFAGNVRDMDDVRREDEKYAASKKKKGRSSSGTDTAAKPGRRTYDYSSLARELSVH